MQILPTLNSTSTSAGSGNPLFGSGGLFGNAAGQGAGLFGALMGLFGQTHGTATPGQAGQAFPAIGAQGTPVLLQPIALNMQGQQLGATPAENPDLSALMAQLQQALAGHQLSPELKNILGDGTQTLASLKEKIDNLSDDQRDAVMAELAALLAPLMPTPVAAPEFGQNDIVTDASAEITAAANTAASAPSQGQFAPAPNSAPASDAAAGQEAPEASPAPAAPAKHHSTDASARPTANTTTPETGVNVAPATDVAETPAQEIAAAQPLAKAEKKPEASAKKAQEPKSEIAATSSTERPALAPSAAKTSANKTETVNGVTQPPAEKAEKPVVTAQTDTQAAPLPESQRTEKPSFSSHLESVKLNRTGAHTPVSDQIAVHLTKAAQNGQDKMTIRLQPPELGRIDIKLDISADGMIKASIQVDQPATLDLMLRDQKGLEKAFSDAGLKTDNGSLSFNLRGDGLPQRQQGGEQSAGQNGSNGDAPAFSLNGEESDALPAGVMEMTWFIGPDRVDVRI